MNRVALLVPCHNAARFVPPFLAMVRAQSRPYDEVLFFDDGSTDDTARLLLAAGCQVLRGEHNGGAAYARNRLLAATTADYVHLHDIDDELDPAFVATLLPDVRPDGAVCCAFQRRRPDGHVEREDRFRDLPVAGPRVAYFIDHFLTFNAVIYPRAVLRELGGFEESLRIHEDLHLLLRVAASGLPYVYHDRILTTWQLRGDSTYHAAESRHIAAGLLDCLADLNRRWPRKIRRELGPTLLDLAWQFHAWRDTENTRRAARLAQSCGQWSIANRGGRMRWLSRLFGPVGAYWLLAFR